MEQLSKVTLSETLITVNGKASGLKAREVMILKCSLDHDHTSGDLVIAEDNHVDLKKFPHFKTMEGAWLTLGLRYGADAVGLATARDVTEAVSRSMAGQTATAVALAVKAVTERLAAGNPTAAERARFETDRAKLAEERRLFEEEKRRFAERPVSVTINANLELKPGDRKIEIQNPDGSKTTATSKPVPKE